jgi:serine phosphatase RsbU (regulator of sigma subunit)
MVVKPLGKIARTLNSQQTHHLKGLTNQNNEFGRIASLIVNFFEQREALRDNLEQLSQTQKDMAELNIELADQKYEIEDRNAQLQELYEEMQEQNREITTTADNLYKANREITESIKYASFIQNAALAPSHKLLRYFPEHFIYYKPKSIVSGDFYWFRAFENNNCMLAVADCTGHGLSGSLLSMLGISFLNEISGQLEQEEFTPSDVLNSLRSYLKSSLNQEESSDFLHDGMDIALCIFEPGLRRMHYACAFHNIYVIRLSDSGASELFELKGNRIAVGVYRSKESFSTFSFDLCKDDLIYFFSDGIVDQFGGANNKKYLASNFKSFLLKICRLPVAEQREAIIRNFKEWKGTLEQTDDVVVMGLKIP